jgi:hypothetical protein
MMPSAPLALVAAFDLAFGSTCGDEKCVADATSITTSQPEPPHVARWMQLRDGDRSSAGRIEVTLYRPRAGLAA